MTHNAFSVWRIHGVSTLDGKALRRSVYPIDATITDVAVNEVHQTEVTDHGRGGAVGQTHDVNIV